MRPLAASWTVILPATMSFTVCEMVVQSRKVTKGTFSFSQYVTKSKDRTSALGLFRLKQISSFEFLTLVSLGEKQVSLLGR